MISAFWRITFYILSSKMAKETTRQSLKKTGMTEVGITGFLLIAAYITVMFDTSEKMKEKEQNLNVVFVLFAAFVIGEHLAFTTANAPNSVVPMMATKIIFGIASGVIALIFYKPSEE